MPGRSCLGDLAWEILPGRSYLGDLAWEILTGRFDWEIFSPLPKFPPRCVVRPPAAGHRFQKLHILRKKHVSQEITKTCLVSCESLPPGVWCVLWQVTVFKKYKR